MQSRPYRPDIEGLRAIAVVPVCLFHAGFAAVPGGYVGVDVFFVISGFLMAIGIGDALAGGSFSFKAFYASRIRRIFPALFVVLAVSTCVALIMLPPRHLQDFGAALAASAAFVANVFFASRSANYFDATTASNPLLHLWSLSVEVQFYILFPIFLAAIWRLGRRAVLIAIVAIMVLSLGLSIWTASRMPTAGFYLLPTRTWELLAGALLSFLPRVPRAATLERSQRWLVEAAAMTGLVLFAYALTQFSPELAYPDAAALIPVTGTALLIASGGHVSTLVARLLGAPPLRAIGRGSYALYLWHWPLLVFSGAAPAIAPPTLAQELGLVAAAAVTAFATYRYVEQPFRQRRVLPDTQRLFAFASASVAVAAAAGIVAASTSGWPQRFPGLAAFDIATQLEADALAAANLSAGSSRCFVSDVSTWDGERCFLSTGTRRTLLWGDSFANSLAPGLAASDTDDYAILQLTAAQCPPLTGYDAATQPACAPFNRDAIDIIARHGISHVILAANWVSYLRRHKIALDDIGATVASLRARGLHVIVVGQSPVFAFRYPDEALYRRYSGLPSRDVYRAELTVDRSINAAIAAASKADVFFDPMPVFCDGSNCAVRDHGLYLFRDYGHVTLEGSRRMASALLMQLRTHAERAAQQPRP